MTPELFKLWSGIAMAGGALERRVWTRTKKGPVYPNLYTLLVAPPGVGKGIIEEVRELWTSATKPLSLAPAFHVAPDSMTKAALIDTLASAKSIYVPSNKPPVISHPLLIASEEFSVLVPAYDMEFIGSLNSIWNNKALHEERRRYGKNSEIKIENPYLNLLAGTQPSYMASLFPEEAWNSGLARRLLMIYSAEAPLEDIFGFSPDMSAARDLVVDRLSDMSALFGEAQWTPAAQTELSQWHQAGGPPTPTHTKLVHYNRSRTLHVLKLSIIASVSRGDSLIIELEDVERARSWLLGAERMMPDIFRAMLGRSDKDVIDELHSFALAEYFRARNKPLDGQLLRRFLIPRVPHDKVESLMLTADRAGLVQRVAGTEDLWVPKGRGGVVE